MAEPVRSQAAESRSIEEIARRVARGLHGKRGEEIVVLEVRDLLQIASYFVLATGSSARALQTLADGADRLLHESTLDRLGIEGTRGGRWICL
ncbi:MAG: RsfS/YbeB/iojap family protein, partial [Planctomycetota bacterium]